MPCNNFTFFRNAWTLFSNVSKKKDWVDWRYGTVSWSCWSWVSCAGATPETWLELSDSSLSFCCVHFPTLYNFHIYIFIYIYHMWYVSIWHKSYCVIKTIADKSLIIKAHSFITRSVRNARRDITKLRSNLTKSNDTSMALHQLPFPFGMHYHPGIRRKNHRNILLFDFSCLMTAFLFLEFSPTAHILRSFCLHKKKNTWGNLPIVNQGLGNPQSIVVKRWKSGSIESNLITEVLHRRPWCNISRSICQHSTWRFDKIFMH